MSAAQCHDQLLEPDDKKAYIAAREKLSTSLHQLLNSRSWPEPVLDCFIWVQLIKENP